MDRDLRERLIASKTVFEGRLISVSVDEVGGGATGERAEERGVAASH